MIGYEVINGGGTNPVPALWNHIFEEDLLCDLRVEDVILPMFIGWMGEYDKQTDTFTYIAGYIMPKDTIVPEGFVYRDLSPCHIGIGTINGSFADGEVHSHSHQMTIEGFNKAGYEPDYSFGWSAEAYPLDLSFDATEGSIHYICPCKAV